MSDLTDVGAALDAARGWRRSARRAYRVGLPGPAGIENLRAIATLADTCHELVGLSDHGSGLMSAVAAVTLGACIHERHLVLSGDTQAIDAPVSSTPLELAAIVRAMEQTRCALGSGISRVSRRKPST